MDTFLVHINRYEEYEYIFGKIYELGYDNIQSELEIDMIFVVKSIIEMKKNIFLMVKLSLFSILGVWRTNVRRVEFYILFMGLKNITLKKR